MSGYDRVTYCDVVECCEMCPMYGYDCDGDKRAETPTTDEKHQLSAETPTVLISRADAKQQISEWATIITKPTLLDKDATMVVLDALPSAEAVQGVGRYEKAMQKLREMPRCLNGVKVKQINKIQSEDVQGEWIWKTDIPIGDGRTSAGYICSHCGKDYWHGNKLKFCPNCGAKMKGGGSE